MTSRLRRGLGSASVALVLGATLTACGGGAPEKKDLEDALLSASDLPDGFELAEDDDDDDDDDDTFEGTCLADIGDFDDRVGDPDVKAKAEYEQPDSSLPNSFNVGISYYEDDVDEAFADFADELAACTSVESEEDGVVWNLEIDSENADIDDADDSVRLTMKGTISSEGFEIALQATVIAILKDRYVSTVGAFEFEGDELSGEVDGLAEKQFENVLDLL